MPERRIVAWLAQVSSFVRRRRWYVGSLAVVLVLVLAMPDPSTSEERSTPAAEASPYAAVARGRVDIEGGIIQLAARRDGIVKSVFVEEGELVKKNQVLAALDDQQARLNIDLAAKEAVQAQATQGGLSVRLQAAEREHLRLRGLVEVGASARIELDQAQDQMALLRGEIAMAEAAYQAARARARIADYELEQRLVRAPLNGRIVRRQARPGDGVSTLNVTPLSRRSFGSRPIRHASFVSSWKSVSSPQSRPVRVPR